MILFCLFWLPSIYFLRRSLTEDRTTGGNLALIVTLGLAAAGIRLYFGDLVPNRGFGLIAWLHVLLDVIGLPLLLPLGVHAALSLRRRPPAGKPEFMLQWLMPAAVLGALRWSAAGDPLALVLAPLLWSAGAFGVPLLIALAKDEIGFKYYAALFAALFFVPLLTTVYWAFFTQRGLLGLLLALPALAPLGWWSARNLTARLRRR